MLITFPEQGSTFLTVRESLWIPQNEHIKQEGSQVTHAIPKEVKQLI